MRVLIVEDELRMAGLIRRGLTNEGLAADVAGTGEDALWMAQAHPYDAIVLDVMLPGLNGFETCRRLRNDGVWAPVLMLTARDSVEDRVAGLDTGADDYLVKPFAFAELLARLRALARRGAGARGGAPPPPPGGGGGGGRPRGGPAPGEGVRVPGDVHAPTGRVAAAPPPPRAGGGLRERHRGDRRRLLRPPPAAKDRQAV